MRLVRLVFMLLCMSAQAWAHEIEITGEMRQSVASSSGKEALFCQSSACAGKQVTLLKLQLSENARSTIRHRVQEAYRSHADLNLKKTLPRQVQLGMSELPVLDQGMHGTCATFANTAAVDAAMKKGNYISELCLLQLGLYLESYGYTDSGWAGSFGPVVLNRMQHFGVVTKAQQKAIGCGGYTAYPQREAEPSTGMDLSEYHQISEDLTNEFLGWSSLLDVYQAILKETDTARVLEEVKSALNSGDRVTFGILLIDLNLGVAGAVGHYQAENDTWLLTDQILEDVKRGTSFGGHEMIITGYDDDAVVMDNQGQAHHGLLKLRNSWGSDIGDKGDFYMSYDYFKGLVIEAQRIRSWF